VIGWMEVMVLKLTR